MSSAVKHSTLSCAIIIYSESPTTIDMHFREFLFSYCMIHKNKRCFIRSRRRGSVFKASVSLAGELSLMPDLWSTDDHFVDKVLTRNDVIWRILRKYPSRGVGCSLNEEKNEHTSHPKSMDKSRIWGTETPEPIATKCCMSGPSRT